MLDPCFVWTRWGLIHKGSHRCARGQDTIAPHLEVAPVPIDDGYDPVPQRFLTMELTEGAGADPTMGRSVRK
jgi:hypothetical protein